MSVPKLLPLKQWRCDSCGELIEKPQDGYVEWRDRKNSAGLYMNYGFRIVHHAPHSPRAAKGGNCYYSNEERGGDLDLEAFLGYGGLIHMTSFIDAGKEFDRAYTGPSIDDLRNWTETLRRLQIPYYEEARGYFAEARRGNWDDANEVYFYVPETLKKIIVEYGS